MSESKEYPFLPVEIYRYRVWANTSGFVYCKRPSIPSPEMTDETPFVQLSLVMDYVETQERKIKALEKEIQGMKDQRANEWSELKTGLVPLVKSVEDFILGDPKEH